MLHGSDISAFRNYTLVRLMTLNNPYYKADKIYVNSAYTGKLLKEAFPSTKNDKIILTHLGVNSFWLESTSEITDKIKNLPIPENKKIVLSVGRLLPLKKQDKCMNALQNLPSSLKENIIYIIAGKTIDKEYETFLRKKASKMAFPVIFTGTLNWEDLRILYGMSSVFCLPSPIESFGLVFLEAAGSGVPSVASNSSAIPEIVIDGETGILVKPDDSKALTKALQTLLEDNELRKKMGAAAKERAKIFTWYSCAKKTLEAYDA